MFPAFKLALFILLITFTSTSLAQANYKITYSVEPIFNKSLEGKSGNTKDIINKMLDYAEKLNFNLLVNQMESSFEEEEFLLKGSDNPLDNIYLRGARNIISFNEKTYTNFKSKSVVFVKNLVDKDFVVKRSFYDFQWKIENVRKTILGFEVIKAEGKYYDPVKGEELKVEAWFVPEIPLQAGPDIYMGLPGLILEIHLQKVIIRAKEIQKNLQQRIDKPNDMQAIDEEEYELLLSKMRRKFINN